MKGEKFWYDDIPVLAVSEPQVYNFLEDRTTVNWGMCVTIEFLQDDVRRIKGELDTVDVTDLTRYESERHEA